MKKTKNDGTVCAKMVRISPQNHKQLFKMLKVVKANRPRLNDVISLLLDQYEKTTVKAKSGGEKRGKTTHL